MARGWHVVRLDAAPRAPVPAGRLRLGLRQRALFTRQLAALVAVSPVEEALRTMLRQAGAGREAGVIGAIHAGVCEGQGLAQAMARAPRAFPPVYRAMIGAGKAPGACPRLPRDWPT
ncbi:type II secretion system F family protein [Novosphingobium pokkalii]|uniref:type II secretion system F family protein n=1 Tax=Novosphingobium pokkalii TaxID=1770194 RepID=UPI003626A8AA